MLEFFVTVFCGALAFIAVCGAFCIGVMVLAAFKEAWDDWKWKRK